MIGRHGLLSVLTCSGPMEDSPDVGTEVTEVMLICPVIWFMLLIPPVLVAMDTLMFILLLYMLVFACCPKCGGDCCENMLECNGKMTMSAPSANRRAAWSTCSSGIYLSEGTEAERTQGGTASRCWGQKEQGLKCLTRLQGRPQHREGLEGCCPLLCLCWTSVVVVPFSHTHW